MTVVKVVLIVKYVTILNGHDNYRIESGFIWYLLLSECIWYNSYEHSIVLCHVYLLFLLVWFPESSDGSKKSFNNGI